MLPPAYMLASVAAMVAVSWLLPIISFLAFPRTLVGLAPIIAGVVLNLAADRALKRHKTTVKPFERSNYLVTDGVFAISRHPM